MSTMSPVEVEAFRLLRDHLYARLEEAEYLADDGPWSPDTQQSVRTVMANLVTLLRALIAHHDVPPATKPRTCPTCNTYWPCRGLHVIYDVLRDPHRELVKVISARRS
ncbi:MAG: hypothetical protein ACJ72N_06535 [Labedaea sp.]